MKKVNKDDNLGMSMGLVGSSSAESDPATTCQIAGLGTPRARATEPGRGSNLRLVYTQLEKRPAAEGEKSADVHLEGGAS